MLENIMVQNTYEYIHIDADDEDFLEYCDHMYEQENNY